MGWSEWCGGSVELELIQDRIGDRVLIFISLPVVGLLL